MVLFSTGLSVYILTWNVIYEFAPHRVFAINDVNVITRYLNHPALTLGYRLEVDGASVVYCCDHEPHSAAMASGAAALTGMDRRYMDFVAGADLVIHDCQYTAAEYRSKIGCGQSPVEYAVRVCREAGVKRLAMTHYDPLCDDVILPTTTHGEIRLRCITQPDAAQAALLDRLGIVLPKRIRQPEIAVAILADPAAA